MADDRSQSPNAPQDRQRAGGAGTSTDTGNSRLDELAEKHGGLHPGMTSPDSTQAPLRADTGEPDQEAVDGSGAENPNR